MGSGLSQEISGDEMCNLSKELSEIEEVKRPQYIKKVATALQISVAAMEIFAGSLHADGVDRCALATFNNIYKMKLRYNSKKENILKTLHQIMREGAGGQTLLRDTMVEFSTYLANNKQRGNPCVCIVVTDGEDNCSTRSTYRATNEIRKFCSAEENFFFLLGVGRGVKHLELAEMMKNAGGIYIPVQGFGILMKVFAALSLRVRKMVQIQGVNLRTQLHNINVMRVQEANVLTRGALDWGIALDISGSMDAKIDLE